MSHVSQHVARTLAHHVQHVFGVMGNGNAYFIDTLQEITGVTFTPVRHEAGGVTAADAYYRASNQLAATTVTYGAGFTNAITPLVEAVQARIPLILVAGDEPTSGKRAWDVDQPGMAQAAGIKTFTVGRNDVSATVLTSIEYALTHRVPVILAIPYDLVTLEVEDTQEIAPLTPISKIAFDERAQPHVKEAAESLANAKRPLILAGRGAWIAEAGNSLGRLATATGALTSTTALARGIFPEQQYDLGVTGGFGAEVAMRLVLDADVVLVVGAALNQFTMRFGALFSPTTRVIQIDIADSATHPVVDQYIRGDAKLVSEAIITELESIKAPPSEWRLNVNAESARRYDTPQSEYAPDGRLDPRAVAQRLGELLPEERVVVTDGGHFIGWANMYWPITAPDRMMMIGTAYQSIGLGIYSIAGAAQAKPHSTIILSSGDGGGLMALSDLETAVRVTGGRGIAVIWNDAVYAAELNLYGLKGLDTEPMLIPEVDFASLATSLGADGHVVSSLDDLDILNHWSGLPVEERKFLLLDCRTSPNIIAPYQQEIIEMNS